MNDICQSHVWNSTLMTGYQKQAVGEGQRVNGVGKLSLNTW